MKSILYQFGFRPCKKFHKSIKLRVVDLPDESESSTAACRVIVCNILLTVTVSTLAIVSNRSRTISFEILGVIPPTYTVRVKTVKEDRSVFVNE